MVKISQTYIFIFSVVYIMRYEYLKFKHSLSPGRGIVAVIVEVRVGHWVK